MHLLDSFSHYTCVGSAGRTTSIGILNSSLHGVYTPTTIAFSVIYASDVESSDAGVAAAREIGSEDLPSRYLPAASAPLPPVFAAEARLAAAKRDRQVLGVQTTQFVWERLLRAKLPLPALALYIKVSKLHNYDVDWTIFPEDGDWRAAGLQRITTHTFINRWGVLVSGLTARGFSHQHECFHQEECMRSMHTISPNRWSCPS